MNQEMLHPAHLWIGPEEDLRLRAHSFIRRSLCKKDSCGACHNCIALDNKRHHAVLWLSAENYYTLSQLEPVFKTLAFSLQPGELFFIVFERADYFNAASANSLLKQLEEPPRGYHFILLAQRREGIVATIRSRCVIEEFLGDTKAIKHPLYTYFTDDPLLYAGNFHKELGKHHFHEREVYDLLDQVSEFWHEQYKVGHKKNNILLMKKAHHAIRLIDASRAHLAMPGSAKLFLKNLFLSFFLAF